MDIPDISGVFDSLSTITKGESVTLEPKNSCGVELKLIIEDNIYGLLVKKELSGAEVALLTALLQYRG